MMSSGTLGVSGGPAAKQGSSERQHVMQRPLLSSCHTGSADKGSLWHVHRMTALLVMQVLVLVLV